MSKRLGGSNFFKSHEVKKPRIEIEQPAVKNPSPNDDVWGEDFDEDILTQLEQSQSMCLPSYSEFQKKDQIITSTFKHDFAIPSTSKTISSSKNLPANKPSIANIPQKSTNNFIFQSNSHLTFKRNSSIENLNSTQTIICNNEAKNVSNDLLKEIERLKDENKKLSEKFITKEGEVTILRNQLKQTQKTIDTIRIEKMQSLEKQKIEWSEKISALNTNLNSAKSELEIKNLEVMTLTNRCRSLESATVKKINILSQSQADNGYRQNDDFSSRFNASFTGNSNIRRHISLSTKSIQTQNIMKVSRTDMFTFYPLRKEIPEDIFRLHPNIRILNDNNNVNIQSSKEDHEVDGKNLMPEFITKLEHKKNFSLEYIFPEINNLISLSLEELESNKNNLYFNKLIHACQTLLFNITNLLKTEKKNVRRIYISLNDRYYIKNVPTISSLFNSRPIIQNEFGIIVRQYLMIIAILVKYSKYLANYIFGKTLLNLSDDLELNKEIISFKNNFDDENYLFLKIIKDIVLTIRDHDFSNNCCGLLIGIIELLTNCVHKSNFDNLSKNLIFDIIKNVTFSCPPPAVLCSITKLLNRYSFNKDFSRQLCCNSNKDKFSSNENKIYFDEDSCLLQHYSVQLDDCLHKSVTNIWIAMEQLEYLTVFFHNQYLANNWTSSKDECQCTLNTMQCFFNLLNCSLVYYKKYKLCFQERRNQTHIHNIFKMAVNMLHIFSYNKDTEMYKLFKLHRQNVHILKELSSSFEFEQETLNMLEEMEADNNYQIKLNKSEIFHKDEATQISSELFDNFFSFV